jgi:glycosyltransferase involved in cell wall biosynthesis
MVEMATEQFKQEAATISPSKSRQGRPVFGIILFGGSLSGALVRDVRLANELAARGYRVHVWWAMDWTKSAGLDSRIVQHWLFSGLRFRHKHGRSLLEWIGRWLNFAFSDKARALRIQKRPQILKRLMTGLMNCVCDGVERELPVVRRFAHELNETGVTHLLPMLEMLCPWIAAARPMLSRPVKYLVTFQGYELYSTYARAIGREAELFARLRESVEQSDWPAIAVSADYRLRVGEDIGVDESKIVAIPPGVPPSRRMPRKQAIDVIRQKFPEFDASVPLITFLGRRDTEKGIDLLLYAAAMLRRRGYQFQLICAGPTLWGNHYGQMCMQIAEELRLGKSVLWRRYVEDDVRTALFSHSRCVVYPSIHREPFGMVPVEALAHGTPAIVPNYGGVSDTIEAQGVVGGLRFNVWDSADLARQVAQLLDDDKLHHDLSVAGPRVADYYSVSNLADRVLRHIGIEP